MKKFEFKLKRVLDVREIEEELAENRLFQARQRAREIEKKIDQLESLQEDLYQYLRTNQEISVENNILTRRYLFSNRQKIERTEGDLLVQEEEVESCRQEFFKRKKKKEALEKLKEKEYRRYNREMILTEQKELDEIASRVKGVQGG